VFLRAGRYDSSYEGVNDYPAWIRPMDLVSQRNFEARASKCWPTGRAVKRRRSFTHRYARGESQAAYRALMDDSHARGILLKCEREAGDSLL